MRGKLLVGIVLAATMFSLTACGVKEKKEMKTKKVSVSESADMTLEERREAKFKADIEGMEMALSKNCLYLSNVDDSSDSNLYSSNDNGYITQWNREGKKLSRIQKNGYAVETCSDKRLICTKYKTADREDAAELYSIPIKQTESGESVQWDEEEKVASDYYDAHDVFLYEPYLIYADEDENTLTRLNLETKEKKTIQFDISTTWFDDSYIIDGLLYLVKKQSDGERVYCIRIDDWTLEKLYEDKTEGEIQDICIDGQYLYVLISAGTGANGKIIRYDMERRKVEGQLSYEKIDTLLQKEGVTESSVTKDIVIYEHALCVYEGRIYLPMSNLDIKTKTREEGCRWVLVSCSTEGMTDLKYEREISEWCCENSAHYSCSDGSIEYDEVAFWAAYEDEFYFTYVDKQKEKEHLMRYHLDTKKWEEVSENELVYRAIKEAEYIEE